MKNIEYDNDNDVYTYALVIKIYNEIPGTFWLSLIKAMPVFQSHLLFIDIQSYKRIIDHLGKKRRNLIRLGEGSRNYCQD